MARFAEEIPHRRGGEGEKEGRDGHRDRKGRERMERGGTGLRERHCGRGQSASRR